MSRGKRRGESFGVGLGVCVGGGMSVHDPCTIRLDLPPALNSFAYVAARVATHI